MRLHSPLLCTTTDILSLILPSAFSVMLKVSAAFFSFELLMMNRTNMAGQQGQGTMGYILSISELQSATEEAPLPLTAQQLQAYAHLAPGQGYPVISVDSEGENNVIMSLNMTQNFPSPKCPSCPTQVIDANPSTVPPPQSGISSSSSSSSHALHTYICM